MRLSLASPADESWWLLTDVLLSVSPKTSATSRGCHVQRCGILLSISPLGITGPSSLTSPRHLPRDFRLLNLWALCQGNKAEVPWPKMHQLNFAVQLIDVELWWCELWNVSCGS